MSFPACQAFLKKSESQHIYNWDVHKHWDYVLFPDCLRVQEGLQITYIGDKLNKFYISTCHYRHQQYQQPGTCLFCLIVQFLVCCHLKVFLQGHCRSAGDWTSYVHVQCYAHAGQRRAVLTASNQAEVSRIRSAVKRGL